MSDYLMHVSSHKVIEGKTGKNVIVYYEVISLVSLRLRQCCNCQSLTISENFDGMAELLRRSMFTIITAAL